MAQSFDEPVPLLLTNLRRRTPPPTPLRAGSLIANRYLVGKVVAQTETGVVYAARDARLGRPVTVELLDPALSADPELVERSVDEARVAAAVSSPHLPHVYEIGCLASGELFRVQEWLEGERLDRMLARRGRLPVAEAVDLVIQACEGLAPAHEAGIAHRHLEPAHLLVAWPRAGKPRLEVLGLGLSVETRPLRVSASRYMAPEQLERGEADPRADVWALGVVLFELIAGSRPFEADSVAEVRRAIAEDPAPALALFRPDVDPELDAVIHHCLAKVPAQRFRDAEALRQALALFGSEATKPELWNIADDPVISKRSLGGAWFGLVVALGLVLLSGWMIAGPSADRVLAWLGVRLADASNTSEPPAVVFEPRVELPRGEYAIKAEGERERPPARVWRPPPPPPPPAKGPYDDLP